MKIMVVGSGGREHAVLWALRETSTRPLDLYCAPGNAGIAEIAACVPIAASDIRALADFVAEKAIELTFVGPEAPLALGIVDEFERRGLAIVGPAQKAARLEASKAFAKEFLARHQIPTARFKIVDSAAEAIAVLRSGEFGPPGGPVVIKADGLAAGKGVVVAGSRAEAEKAVYDMVSGTLIDAAAARQIVIEEALTGTEVSLLLFCDGDSFALMPAARDHKRIGEGDKGPNTGGMGAITDRSVLDQATLKRAVREIIKPTLAGARAEGFPVRGVLFLGLMLTSQGPQVLEYNVRFGDPETQAILVRLRSDLSQIFEAMVSGSLANTPVAWTENPSACVVLASAGYPGKYVSGLPIKGLERAANQPGVKVFHSGTVRAANGVWLTAGGRVLGVTATGETLDEALRYSYAAAADIYWEGMQYRRDIGKFF